MGEKTTIQTSTETRNRLAALTPKGSTLENTIRQLIDQNESRRAHQRTLLDNRFAAARRDPEAVSWATQQAERLARLAQERDGTR
ncbi:hypothetical protein ACL02S_23520 [Nocardia sp. 004]|uniref:hypothetical protein n=1 Tax=Nocardia sp. 004 TaxID=3385978 RepID=UPI0039A316CE